jgi:hypothetical protein
MLEEYLKVDIMEHNYNDSNCLELVYFELELGWYFGLDFG